MGSGGCRDGGDQRAITGVWETQGKTGLWGGEEGLVRTLSEVELSG